MTELTVGRRVQNMRDKRERIFRAAYELFTERGFDGVTTQEISERADVATGTLFRYAASKSELLLMVLNEEFRSALEHGEAVARKTEGISAQVQELIAPIMALAIKREPDSTVYQRELIFGSDEHPHRAESIALMARVESCIGDLLERAAQTRKISISDKAVRAASAAIFGALTLAIARLSARTHNPEDSVEDLNLQVEQIVTGTLELAT